MKRQYITTKEELLLELERYADNDTFDIFYDGTKIANDGKRHRYTATVINTGNNLYRLYSGLEIVLEDASLSEISNYILKITDVIYEISDMPF